LRIAAAAVEQFKQLEHQLLVEQQQHREVVESSEVLERKLTDYVQTVTYLQEEIRAKDHILVEVRMNVEEREKQIETQRTEFEAQQLAALQTSKDLQTANETIQTLEVEICNRDVTIQNMHRDIEYKEQKLSEVIASTSQSQELVRDMECKLSAQDEEADRLKHDLETSHRELQQVQAEVERFHEAGVTFDVCQQLQEQNATLEFSVTELTAELAIMTASLDQSQIECQQLRANLHVTSCTDTELKATISSLEARLLEVSTQSQEEISQWTEKVSSISDQLSSCVAELEQLKERHRITDEEKASLQVALTDKDEKLRTVSLQLEAGEECVHQLRMELEAAASTHQMEVGKLQRQVEESELRVKEMEELAVSNDGLVTGMKAELEDVRKQLEDMRKHEAEHQQMLVDRETLLSNTIASLHQQLEESAARVEFLSAKCKEQDAEVHALTKKLDDRDTKITSLSENFREEELQLVALTEELEACRAQAAKDKVSAEAEWQKIIDWKDADITRLTESAHNQETQMKKYVVVIKKLKQQLQEEKQKQDLEKQSVSSLDDSGTSATEQFIATDEKMAVNDEPDKPSDPVVLLQQPVTSSAVPSSETSHPQLSDMISVNSATEQQISKLKEMNEQLQHEISKLESKSSEYETTIADLSGVVAGLKRENETLKADVESMSVEMRKASETSCVQIQELSTELIHWKNSASDVEQMREDFARLESEKLKAVAKVEAVESEMAKLKSDLDERSAEVGRLNAQLSDEIAGKESVKHAKKIQNELEAEKIRLEMEISRLTDIVLRSEGTIQQLVAELGAEREEFSLRESELEGSSEELQLEVARLAHKVETDVEELENLRSRNNEVEMQLKSLASDKDSVEGERNECMEHSKKLAQEIELLKTECEELRKEKEQLAREFQSNQVMAERKHTALSDQYEMLSRDIVNYQELVESLRSKNSQLEQRLQKSFADDASQVAVSRELEMEREKMEREKLVHSEEVESRRVRESELLCEIKRLQLQIEDHSSREEEHIELRSRAFAVQTENDSLQRKISELEQRVHELVAVEEEQAALQERYLSLLQDNSALIKQSKEMYGKLRSFNEVAENSGDRNATEVAALKAEVETLRSERENASQREHECEQLRAELLALKAELQQQTSELQALRSSSHQPSSINKSESPERLHHELSTKVAEYHPAAERYHDAEHQPELVLNEEAARVHVVPVHSSSLNKVTADDRPNEVSRLKAQVTASFEQLCFTSRLNYRLITKLCFTNF